MMYVHHPAPTIELPGRHAIKRRAMTLGDDGIDVTKKMFAVCFKIFVTAWSLYLDFRSWTVRLAFHLMHGRQAICMPSWPLLLTM
jgi:hypothetical protein